MTESELTPEKESEETKPEKRPRATKADMQKRQHLVFKMLRQGFDKDEIKAQLAQQGLQPKTIQRTWTTAKNTLIALAHEDPAMHIGKMLSWIDYLFQDNTIGPNKDPARAIKVVGLLEKALRHLPKGPSYEPAKTQPENDIITEQLARIIGCR